MAKGDVEGASEAFTRENRTREYTYKTDFEEVLLKEDL